MRLAAGPWSAWNETMALPVQKQTVLDDRDDGLSVATVQEDSAAAAWGPTGVFLCF